MATRPPSSADPADKGTDGAPEKTAQEGPADAPVQASSPGWDAITQALARVYGGQNPCHFGTVLPWSLGGKDPLDGISAYASDEGRAHWHFVTYGFSELHTKESSIPEHSGYGFELTFRLARGPGEERPPVWACSFLQSLGRYVFSTGNTFDEFHHMPLNGPILIGADTEIHAVVFVLDPELGAIETPHGRVAFLQAVGVTRDESVALTNWSPLGLIGLLAERDPRLITALDRPSLLSDPRTRQTIAERTAAEGSSSAVCYALDLTVEEADGGVRVGLGAIGVEPLAARIMGRIPFERDFFLVGEGAVVIFKPAPVASCSIDGTTVTIGATPALAREIAAVVLPRRGAYRCSNLPGLTFAITPSEILDAEDRVVETIG